MEETAGRTIVDPESERYRADLLLLPGLWLDAHVWRAVALGFAQRGWRCVLLDAPRPDAESGELAPWAEHVAGIARSFATKPIVIGHDAGALVALELAARGAVRAAVAVAPLLEGLQRIVPRVRRAALRVWGRGSVQPPDPSHTYFAQVPARARERLLERLAPEPAARLREVERLARPAAPAVPAVLVAQQGDLVVPQLLVEICARGIEADFLPLAGGHWPMLEERIDAWTTRVHRWIIQRAGHGLLLLRGDEDLRE